MAKKRAKQKIPKGFIIDDVPSPHGNGSDRVVRRVGADPILNLYKRKQLTEAQYLAACDFSLAHTICQGSDGGAIDYEKDRVDTSGIIEPLQDYQLDAMERVRQATKALSLDSVIRVEKIVGDGLNIKEYCFAIHRKDHKNFCVEQSDLLKQNLTELAIVWGYERQKAA